MTRRLVIGDGPWAAALVERLARQGPVVWAGPEPRPGPWWWREIDPSSGRGLKRASQEAEELVLVGHGLADLTPSLLVLRGDEGSRRTLLLPPSQAAPALADRWRALSVGWLTGPEGFAAAAWRDRARAGRPLLLSSARPRCTGLEELLAALGGADLPAPAPRALAEVAREVAGPQARIWRAPAGWAARSVGWRPQAWSDALRRAG